MSTKNRNVVISFFTTNVIYLNKGQKLKINTNFTVAVHTILCIAFFEKDNKVTSDFIADSTGMNPVIIRKILGNYSQRELLKQKLELAVLYLISIQILAQNVPLGAGFTKFWKSHFPKFKKLWKMSFLKLR